MNKCKPFRCRVLAALAIPVALIFSSQTACVPIDDQSASELFSSLASDIAQQSLDFVLSFARQSLAAFLL